MVEKLKRRKCECCGKMFTPVNRVQKYCGSNCYKTAFKEYSKQYRRGK